MIVLLAGLAAQAATNYGIKVAGVNVTSDNASGVTGSNISGMVVYSNSTKTLTMQNVTINITSGSERALLNTGCDGLTVRFIGTCTLKTTNKAPIRTEKTTTLSAPSASAVVNITGGTEGAIFMAGSTAHYININGPGKFNITTTKCPAIEGAEDSGSLQTGYYVSFNNVTAELYSPENALRRLYGVTFGESSHVTFKATNNADYSIATSIQNFVFQGNEVILAPYGATASNSAGAFLDKDGNRIKYQDVYVSDNYALLINATNFPDANFRNYMLSQYPKGYFTESELQNVTEIICPNKSISNLKGVEKFPYLQKLVCYSNSIASLDLSSNTRLTYLSCYSNNMHTLKVNNCTQLTYLDCAPNNLTGLSMSNLTNLQQVYCYNNQLTSITFASSMPNLQTVSCYGNKLASLLLTNCPALKTLDVKNNTVMYSLFCHDNALTTLDVTGNIRLENFDCSSNSNLSSITGLADCVAIKKLQCQFTAISDLSAVNNMSELQELSCYGTNISTLTITNKSKLTSVLAFGNSNLTTATITGNSALETLNVNSCPSLTTLKCYSNALTMLMVIGNTALNDLRCYYNANLETITGLASCTAITYLDCEDCAITDLSDVNSLTNIASLWARNNKLTTLSVTGKSHLTKLRVNGNTLLTDLNCSNNALTSLEVSGCTALENFNCSENSSLTAITGLNECTNLATLDNHLCNFSSLNVSNMTKLTTLKCYQNKLTSLNVQGCSKLRLLNCYSNKLTSLTVQGCTALYNLSIHKNQISGSGMTNLVNSLPTRSSSSYGYLHAIHTNEEGNSITADQIATANAKYWKVEKWNGYNGWEEMTISTRGDVNGDGEVTIADVTALIDYLLSGDGTGLNLDAADCDNSGEVGIADVTALIDYLMSGSW